MYCGMMTVCTGTSIVRMTIAKSAPLKRNLYRAKAYPVIAQESTCPSVQIIATRALFQT